ncbi:hypothetical protein [Mycolicibacterium thermoresistibile]
MRGWLQYYGRFYRTKLYALCKRINTYLVRWAGTASGAEADLLVLAGASHRRTVAPWPRLLDDDRQ